MKNVAIFGAGRIGRIHAGNLAALGGVNLKYVCDPMPLPLQSWLSSTARRSPLSTRCLPTPA
jgi:predicted dehydrogenase